MPYPSTEPLNEFRGIPQYDIRGSVTQFDEGVTREQAGLGSPIVSALEATVNENLFRAGALAMFVAWKFDRAWY